MGIVWNRRIGHVVRPVKHRNLTRVQKRFRLLEAKRRRGLPSRAVPFEHVLALALLRLQVKAGEIGKEEAGQAKARLDFAELRGRMLERKRNALRKIRSHRIVREATCINLWQRRAAWLESASFAFEDEPRTNPDGQDDDAI